MSKWNEENTQQLQQIVGSNIDVTVPVTQLEAAAAMLDTTVKSIAAKLRNMGYSVESLANAKTSTFSEDESNELRSFLEANPGTYNYKEISELVAGGKFTNKQIQGKVLALELTHLVKPTEKVVVAAKYTEAEEARFIQLVAEGAFIEDLAAEFDKPINSIRGKALSLHTKGLIDKIPAQRVSNAKVSADPISDLGESIAEMTVAEIAEKTGKTERGVKTALTRRMIKVADYDGEAKGLKARAKREEDEVVA